MDLRQVEQQLCQLPFYQYLWLKPEELPFSERVREVCRGECPMYGKSWSCPPVVGSVTECRERCLRYDKALLLVTVLFVQFIVPELLTMLDNLVGFVKYGE